ncbi:hypothetical protein E2542_SST01279 [Spatholobus suberectus]|nr:hypothetical protein E2542_SST01279 [Spatholobus suberectus]
MGNKHTVLALPASRSTYLALIPTIFLFFYFLFIKATPEKEVTTKLRRPKKLSAAEERPWTAAEDCSSRTENRAQLGWAAAALGGTYSAAGNTRRPCRLRRTPAEAARSRCTERVAAGRSNSKCRHRRSLEEMAEEGSWWWWELAAAARELGGTGCI